jgi:hypothetical protein
VRTRDRFNAVPEHPLTRRWISNLLAVRARVFEIGQARKTAGSDAHSIVMVALRDTGLRHVELDPQLMVLRLLSDRRDELSRARGPGAGQPAPALPRRAAAMRQRSQLSPTLPPHQRPRPKVSPARVNQKAMMASASTQWSSVRGLV